MIARAKQQLVKTVAYLRMSTEEQDKSIDDQKVEVEKYAERHGYEIVRFYIDDGLSGYKEDRAAFQRLVNDAQTIRDFEVILLWSQDRFSRFDILDTAGYWKALRDNDVRIVTVCEGELSFDSIQGILLACINQHTASNFLKKLAKDVARGLKGAAEGGYWPAGPAPYGYRLTADGKRSRLIVDEAAAPFVRTMFRLYTESALSMRAIAARLNEDGARTSKGNLWTGEAVGDVLKNEAYLGRIVFGQTAAGQHVRIMAGEYIDIKRRGTKAVRQQRTDCVVTENAHEAIISADTFERARQRTADGKSYGRNPCVKRSALSGLLHCGHCGRKLGVRTEEIDDETRQRIYCRSLSIDRAARKEECRFCLDIDEVLGYVIETVEEALLSDRQIERFRQAMTRYIGDRRGQQSKIEADLGGQLTDLTGKLQKAEARTLTTPDDMLPLLYGQIRELRERKQKLEADLATESRIVLVSESAVADDARRLVAGLRQARAEIRSSDPAVARRALELLVDRVTVTTKPVDSKSRKSNSHRRTLDSVDIRYKPQSPMSYLRDNACITPQVRHWINGLE